ncbi:MAG: hypothetical protein AB7J32_04770 [Pseudonocardia sp.]
MRPRVAAVLVAPAVLVLLAGCGGDQPSAPHVPSASPPPAVGRPPGPTAADRAACEHHATTSPLVRRAAATYAAMPVPPVRAALDLATAWAFYADPGAADPDLRAAMAEVAAAIGELDAQGRGEVAPGGSLMDPVQLDPARTLAAVDAVDRVCAGVLTS